MGNNPRQGRVEVSAPKISSSKGDRCLEADPRAKDLLKWRHVLGERASGGGAGLRLNEGWPTQRYPPRWRSQCPFMALKELHPLLGRGQWSGYDWTGQYRRPEEEA